MYCPGLGSIFPGVDVTMVGDCCYFGQTLTFECILLCVYMSNNSCRLTTIAIAVIINSGCVEGDTSGQIEQGEIA